MADFELPDDFPDSAEDSKEDFFKPKPIPRRKPWEKIALYSLLVLFLSILLMNFGTYVIGDERFLVFGRGEGANLLAVGSQVYLRDNPVGEVVEVSFDELEVVVSIELLEKLRGDLSKKSRFIVSVLNSWDPSNFGIVIIPQKPEVASDRVFSGADIDLEKAPMADIASSGYWFYIMGGAALLILLVLYKLLKKVMVLIVGGAVIVIAWYFAKDFVDVGYVEGLISQVVGG
jgi:hypothetical protein